MDNFQLWKLATDVALVLSILVLSVRFMRSQTPNVNLREMRDLEIVLKNLLKDADVSSRSLGETLARRQQGLERLLTELESAERRVSVSVQAADDARIRVEKMPRPQQRFQEPQFEGSEERSSAILSRAAAALEQEQFFAAREESKIIQPEPSVRAPRMTKKAHEEFSAPLELETERETESAPRRTGAAAYKSVASRHASSARTNIYGEPLGATKAAPVAASRPRPSRPALNQEIEIERDAQQPVREAARAATKPAAPSINLDQDLEQIYESAEKLLMAGETMDAVASATQLPLDEVRKLARIVMSARRAQQSSEREVEVEAASEKVVTDPTADPRLGVFASIKRQTQVL